MRLGQTFLQTRKRTLKDLNYSTDKAKLNVSTEGYFTFYHYTYEGNIPNIMAEGLWARREVACPDPPEELIGCHLVEGFIDPLPAWLTESQYYNDLGYELTRKYIGDVLLEISLPMADFPIYIADYAHILECKMIEEEKGIGIGFEYDCSNGRECTQAYVNSYIDIHEYIDQHHAPIVQVVRLGEGIAIPSEFIEISKIQPRK